MRVHASMNPMPERKTFDYDMFCKTLVKFDFMLNFLITLKLLFKESIVLNKSRCTSDPNYLLTYDWFLMSFMSWHVLHESLD